MAVGKPNDRGEYPYDPRESFTPEELERALELRNRFGPDPATIRETGRTDHCPHRPACPSVQVCVEEIAWYLRHQAELEGWDVRQVRQG